MAEVGQEELVGVEIARVITDRKPPVLVYEPHHPDADAKGFVAYPNVNPLEEMANFMASKRSYESNIRAFEAIKELVRKSLEIGR